MNDTQAVAVAKGVSDRASEAPINKCFVCEQSLLLSFFFDAFGHDRQKDETKNRLSNLARAFVAHRQRKESAGIYPFYYEGLGTDLRQSPAMADAAQKALIETGKAVGTEAGGQAKDAVTDKAKAAAMGVVQGQSAKLHTQAMRQELPGDLRKALTDPTSYIEGVVQSIFSKVIDIFPQWRDSKLAASTLNTGAQARLDMALKDFDAVLAGQTMPITEVQVAVFGAERGASLARAFVNMLIDQRCKKAGNSLILKSVARPTTLTFKFVGLFDAQSTVAQFGKEYEVLGGRVLGKIVGFVTGLVGSGGLRDAFELDLPSQVQRVVHMVAGNETRVIAAVDTLAKSEAASQEETVYPGAQADVIAGLAPMERGKVVDLARMPARKMLFEAQAAGVPMYTPHQLEKVDPDTARLFAMPTRVNVASQTTPVGVTNMLQAWRRDTGITEGMPLAKALFQAQKAYLAYLKAQHGVAPTITTNRAAFQVSKLKKRTDSYTDPAERLLIDAWDRPQRLSAESMALFALMSHPPALGWTNDATMQDCDVLTTRPITGDPDLLDELKKRVAA
jgi:hypothetical protein